MTYGYEDAIAAIGPLSPAAGSGALDLCAVYVKSITVPYGWQMVGLQTEFVPTPSLANDLMALAGAIREASLRKPPVPEPARRGVRRSVDIAAPPWAKVWLSLALSPEKGADVSDPQTEEQKSSDKEDKERPCEIDVKRRLARRSSWGFRNGRLTSCAAP